jgi:nucleoside-triphosphatase
MRSFGSVIALILTSEDDSAVRFGGETGHLLITGSPGSGKSTAIRRLAALLQRQPRGFYTEEIRKRGERQGFRLVAFDGAKAVIAHVDFPKTHRVSKYGVDVAAIDEACEKALQPARGRELFLVDEIGKMECLSETFVTRMGQLFDTGSTVVASVASRGGGFIGDVKRRKDCELWTLTRANRDAMPERLLEWLRRSEIGL